MDMTTETVRARKPRGQGSTRRGEILDAAKQLFLHEGFEHATMRRIAAEVGVSPTALYLHFSDKEAILDAIAEDFFSELLVKIGAAQATAEPAMCRYRAGVRAYVEFGLERPDEYRLTFQRRAVAGPRAFVRDIPAGESSFAILKGAITELMESGVFRPMDPTLAAEIVWCALHGVTCALIDMPEQVCSDRDALIDGAIDVIAAGLSVR